MSEEFNNQTNQSNQYKIDWVVENPTEITKAENKPPTSSEIYRASLANAVASYDPENKIYSAYLGESGRANALTQETIERLGEGAQDDIEKIREINNIIRKYINVDDLLGMVYQAIYSNINTEIKLSYKNFGAQRNKLKTLKKAKDLIDDFNIQVDIEKFIRDAITIAYAEGNYLCLLRNDDTNWSINKLTLGISEQSGYVEQGNPILLINIKNLTDALKGSPLKNKKGKYLFFKDVGEEIQNTYNDDVFQAYKNKDAYARLDTAYTGTVRINSMGRRYGLSPMFRSLSAVMMLSNFNRADESNAQARAKKIIHQVMSDKLIVDPDKTEFYEELAYAHETFLKAFKQSTVFITSPPYIESIEYIEPKEPDIEIDKINVYRNKVLTSLGISFLANDKGQTSSTAIISLQQLMRTINSISSQVEKVIENFYRTLLIVNGIDLIYVPTITIVDSEMLDMKLKMELSKLLYNVFGASRETVLKLVDIDLQDERAKREQENLEGLDDIFYARATSYNTSGGEDGDDTGGRPLDANPEDPDKQLDDKEYNKNARE